jgi:hypothetical protein
VSLDNTTGVFGDAGGLGASQATQLTLMPAPPLPFPTTQPLNQTWVQGLSYNGLALSLSGVCGPTSAEFASATLTHRQVDGTWRLNVASLREGVMRMAGPRSLALYMIAYGRGSAAQDTEQVRPRACGCDCVAWLFLCEPSVAVAV